MIDWYGEIQYLCSSKCVGNMYFYHPLKKYKDKMLASNMRSAKSDCSQAYLK